MNIPAAIKSVQAQLDQINRAIAHEGHMLRMKFTDDRTKYKELDAKRCALEAFAKETTKTRKAAK